MKRLWQELAAASLGARLLIAGAFMVAVLVVFGVIGLVYGHFTETNVSVQCDQALATLARNNSDKAEAQLQRNTITACHSRAEWIAGAKRYQGADAHEVIVGTRTKPDDVLDGFCVDDPSAPACS